MRPDFFDKKLLGNLNFQIDHYRPTSIFPLLRNEYSNLFYSCDCCNNSKKGYWPETKEMPKILNPCDFVMCEHIDYDENNCLKSMTELGAFFIKSLKLNNVETIAIRDKILFELDMFIKVCSSYKIKLSELHKKNREVKHDQSLSEEVRLKKAELIKKKVQVVSARYNGFKEKAAMLYDPELLKYV